MNIQELYWKQVEEKKSFSKIPGNLLRSKDSTNMVRKAIRKPCKH
jgi:hypothetical protein